MVDTADQLPNRFYGIDEFAEEAVFPEVDIIGYRLVRVDVNQGRSRLKGRLERCPIGDACREQCGEITGDDLFRRN